MKNLPFTTLKMRRVLAAVLLVPLAVGAQTSHSGGAGALAAGRAAVTQAFQAVNYAEASQLDKAYLQTQPHDNEVRIMVANSYAWTGHYDQAIHHYSQLSGTDQAVDANLGMANVYRWNGLAAAAEPLYRQVLATEPSNKDAAEGLTYVQRETQPMTSVSMFLGNDNLDTERQGITLSHRMTDTSHRHRLEIEVGMLEDQRRKLQVDQRDVTLHYADIANPLKPKLEISAQQSPENTLFAAGEIRIPNTPLTVGGGRMNWGKMAFDPNALAANLTANQLRLQASMPAPAGTMYDSYSASAGLRYWLSDWAALGTRLAHQRSVRIGAYRATTAMITIQGGW